VLVCLVPHSLDAHQCFQLEVAFNCFHTAGQLKESLNGLESWHFMGCCTAGKRRLVRQGQISSCASFCCLDSA
jgi:hypothetical protein